MARCSLIDKLRAIALQRLIDVNAWITEESIRSEMEKMMNEYSWGK